MTGVLALAVQGKVAIRSDLAPDLTTRCLFGSIDLQRDERLGSRGTPILTSDQHVTCGAEEGKMPAIQALHPATSP